MRSLTVLIKNCLLDLDIKVNVTVRQKRKELHILLESTYFGDRELLVEAIRKCCKDIDSQIKVIRIYAFLFGYPSPQWIEKVALAPTEHTEAGNEEPQAKKLVVLKRKGCRKIFR